MIIKHVCVCLHVPSWPDPIVAEVQSKHEEILKGKSMQDAVVVETPHPYPAKAHSWTQAPWTLCPSDPGKEASEIGVGSKNQTFWASKTRRKLRAHNGLSSKDVSIASAKKLRVSFHEKSQTLDDCTTLKCLTGRPSKGLGHVAGGLAKSLAGVGARAHLRAISGSDQVHGTMVGQAEGGKWRPDRSSYLLGTGGG